MLPKATFSRESHRGAAHRSTGRRGGAAKPMEGSHGRQKDKSDGLRGDPSVAPESCMDYSSICIHGRPLYPREYVASRCRCNAPMHPSVFDRSLASSEPSSGCFPRCVDPTWRPGLDRFSLMIHSIARSIRSRG
jgi:hypothetical protein